MYSLVLITLLSVVLPFGVHAGLDHVPEAMGTEPQLHQSNNDESAQASNEEVAEVEHSQPVDDASDQPIAEQQQEALGTQQGNDETGLFEWYKRP
ncbi:hypothetical protein EDC56_1014 [Sinobacterium caligoides]|uniref:Secreted protein n=1 Tax=Sinobacterium caligoides TaxID=933926 RepID=A0A3N2E071_9GAMM|nr:hypothetical protein [Sinobacterium caligoides]ROS05484.1 hypothetical protein EDC56_1014 [Sinobacterium caligoides]